MSKINGRSNSPPRVAPVPHGSGDRSHATVRSCYPCSAVLLHTEGAPGSLRAEITFDLGGAAPFEASPEDLASARRHKKTQSELVFGEAGWLRHDGLFESVSLSVVPASRRPSHAESPSGESPSGRLV